ncbi:Agenet and bromo-adjacent-like protein [Thalictrum thalictroides]|uniref:Agenet and bromo-adjacent-like protein n=1 Tax=Thalictrum thalictroides TaxID=46969 RepID=A0A7J6VLU3_THATH|nr:Agenet and bromo-adjacent-like protein [Thalictrum thalictroides]
MGPLYLGWEEVIISNEKGSREVNYYLKRRDGKDLAVVGKERTIRHMSYTFVFRNENPSSISIPPVKLKSRREVIDWLSSVVSDLSSHGSSQQVGRSVDNDAFDADISSLKDSHIRNYGPHSKEFLWLGPPTCRKRRKHYHSFYRNGITISVHDFVYVLAEENKRLVAYLEDLYEDSRNNKMVVVRWFHKIDEVGIVLPPNFNDREIFFSLCLQDLSVECIDGLATVLSPQHFEKYLNEATHTHWQPFLCHRQFDNDDITDFDITQVQGYWRQEVLRYMYTVSKHLESYDEDEDAMKTRPKKKQCRSKSKEIDQQLNGNDKNVRETSHMDVQKLCNGFVKEPNSAASLSKKDMIQHTPQKHLPVDCHVEVLSQDSGIRGCWFRAVVIKRSKLKLKVRYQDIKDAEDETKSVEEWVLASRIAVTDQLGIRLCGRTTLRPFPASNKDGVSLGFVDVGTPVDAWWHDGWWEGIVVRKETDGKIHVYFPGEKKLSIFGCNDLRRSQDWLSNKWNSIESRPDLVNSILDGLATKQDGSKSCDGGDYSVQMSVPNDRPAGSNDAVVSVSLKKERAAFNRNVHCLKPQSDIGKEIKAVPNLVKDDLLAQLKWCSSRKRRRGREKSQRRASSGLTQRSDGSSSSSREDLEPSIDCQRFLAPNSLVFDTESCKYQGDSLLNASIPPLTGLVLSR